MKKVILKSIICIALIFCTVVPFAGCNCKLYETQNHITFDADGGTVDTDVYIFTTGDVLNGLPIATKEGCVFLYWYVEGSGVRLREGRPLYLRTDVVAKAIYKGANQVFIDCDTVDGFFEQEFNALYDANSTEDYKVPRPKKFGYKFTGWTVNGGQDKVMDVVIPKGQTNDVALVANWEAKTYNVTLNFQAYRLSATGMPEGERSPCTLNGHSQYDTIRVPYDTKIDIPGDNPAIIDGKQSYNFVYWFKFNGEVGDLTNVTPIYDRDKKRPTVFNDETVGEATDITVYILFEFAFSLQV